jgi:hypothetical protein
MQRRNARACLLLSVGLVLAAGCDTIKIDHHAKLEARATSLAEGYCAAYQACDCTPLGTDAVHPDPEQCVSDEKARLLSAFEQAEDQGLEFDSACMDQLLSRYESLGCESIASLHSAIGNPALAENFGCALYHGEQVDGVCAIVDGTSWSDCAAGRMCNDGLHECQPVVASKAEGDACAFAGYSSSLDCKAWLYCDQFDGCQPAGVNGHPCLLGGDGSGQCVADHFCAPLDADAIEGTCQPRLQAGEPCPLGSGNDPCHGRCEESPDSQDPAIGACLDVPAVCLDEQLRPHS